MKRRPKNEPKNVEQQQRGQLRQSRDYATARGNLALQQAARIKQIREEKAQGLIESRAVRALLTRTAVTMRRALREVRRRFDENFPDVPETVREFIAEQHRGALGILLAGARSPKRRRKGNGADG
jgi:hypothetical protein